MAVSPSVINKIKWVLFQRLEPDPTAGILWAKPVGDTFSFLVYDDGTWKDIGDTVGIVIPEISTSISAFTNDAGYLTAVDLSGYSTTEEMNAAIQTALADYYTKTEADTLLGGKQDTLVSGTNIKTINNESILGSGNITIQGGGGSQVQSDWNQTDTEADDYIKNKPTIPTIIFRTWTTT